MQSWLRKNRGEIILLSAFALVMGTNLRLPVISTLQRGLLASGLWRAAPPASPAPGPPVQLASLRTADYPYPLPLLTLDGRPANLRQFRG